MTSTTSYLEQYLDSLENLPTELKKNFNNMHDLDSSNKDILVEIDTASDEYLRKGRDLSPGKRKAEMEKIQVKIHRYANDELIEGDFTWIFKFGAEPSILLFEENMKEINLLLYLKLFWRET